MFEELYQDLILEHAKRPKNRGELPAPARSLRLKNPLCGDEVEFYIDEKNGEVLEAKFSGHGCTISQSAASIFSDLIRGKSVGVAAQIASDFRALLHGETLPSDRREALGELVALEGVKAYPTRLKCALLAGEVVTKLLKPS